MYSEIQRQLLCKKFTSFDQYPGMAFAQLTYRESLRDIEACLRAQQNKLYYMGIRGKVSHNTLFNVNNVRAWQIYADFAQALINIARKLYVDDNFGLELESTVHALNLITIELCLSTFLWAGFHHGKSAIKLLTLLDILELPRR